MNAQCRQNEHKFEQQISPGEVDEVHSPGEVKEIDPTGEAEEVDFNIHVTPYQPKPNLVVEQKLSNFGFRKGGTKNSSGSTIVPVSKESCAFPVQKLLKARKHLLQKMQILHLCTLDFETGKRHWISFLHMHAAMHTRLPLPLTVSNQKPVDTQSSTVRAIKQSEAKS